MKRLILAVTVFCAAVLLPNSLLVAGGKFDEFCYNYQARIFVGKADGVDLVLDGLCGEKPIMPMII